MSELRGLLKERGIKHTHVARCCGIDNANFSRIVSGQTTPLVTTALKIAEVVGVSVEELFGEKSVAPTTSTRHDDISDPAPWNKSTVESEP